MGILNRLTGALPDSELERLREKAREIMARYPPGRKVCLLGVDMICTGPVCIMPGLYDIEFIYRNRRGEIMTWNVHVMRVDDIFKGEKREN